MSDWQDHYLVLGVDRNATQQEIREAYKFKAFTQHPDRLTNAPESVRNRAEEELKKLNVAYEFLGDSQKRDQYNSEWDQKKPHNNGINAGGQSSLIQPRPVVDPQNICFWEADAGEKKHASFIIQNAGGLYNRLWVDNPDSWVRVISGDSVNNTDQLPFRVEIEASGNEWNKSYLEDIKVKLDEQETKVRVELRTKKKPIVKPYGVNQQNAVNNTKNSSSKKGLSYYIKFLIFIVILYYGYNFMTSVLFDSHSISPSFNDVPKVSHADTKTAYTRDGISFVTLERVQENIKYEYAKPGDYKRVQVPLNTTVVGASIIPGET